MLKLPGTRSFSPIILLRVHVIIDDDFGIYHQPHTARHDAKILSADLPKLKSESQLCAQSALCGGIKLRTALGMWCDVTSIVCESWKWVELKCRKKVEISCGHCWNHSFGKYFLHSSDWIILISSLMHFHDFSFAPRPTSPCGAGQQSFSSHFRWNNPRFIRSSQAEVRAHDGEVSQIWRMFLWLRTHTLFSLQHFNMKSPIFLPIC